MTVLRRLRPLIPILLVSLAALAPIPASAQSKSDVERAKSAEEAAYEALLAADAELNAALEELERIQGKLWNLEWRIDQLTQRIGEYETDVSSLEENARRLVVEAYTNGGSDLITAAFAAGSIQDLLTSQVLIDKATSHDLVALDRLSAVNREMDRLQVDLDAKTVEVEAVRAEQASVVLQTEEIRDRARKVHDDAKAKYASVYARYQERLAREAAARAARSSGAAAGLPSRVTNGVVCPVAGGASFIDSWGYPRSGGRTHKGTDMFAPRGTPLVAMYSGSVRVNSHSLGGKQVYVYGDNGLFYYYAHLDGWASGLSTGDRVDRGQVIGYVGDTGNAWGTPHLHLGMGPIGGGLVNPYPTVRAAC